MVKNNKPEKKGKARNYFRGVRSELKKVSWPTRKELTKYTIVVLAVVAIMTVLIWVLDLGFHGILNLFVS